MSDTEPLARIRGALDAPCGCDKRPRFTLQGCDCLAERILASWQAIEATRGYELAYWKEDAAIAALQGKR